MRQSEIRATEESTATPAPAGGPPGDRRNHPARLEIRHPPPNPEFPEAGGLGAAGDQSLVANQQFILQQKFKELGVTELMAGGFLESYIQRSGQSRQSEPCKGGMH